MMLSLIRKMHRAQVVRSCAGIGPAPIEALNVGISSRSAGDLVFTFYERAAGESWPLKSWPDMQKMFSEAVCKCSRSTLDSLPMVCSVGDD